METDKTNRQETVMLLLDSAPRSWSSQEDRHLLLCLALIERGSRPVIVFSGALPEKIQKRFRSAGVPLEQINYVDGVLSYYRELKKVVRKYDVTLAHVIFFDYFSAISWVTRAAGVKKIIYEMQNGGLFRATSWRRQLIHLRNRIATTPMIRIIAISNYIKEQLVAGGVKAEKIDVRYLGVDTERFHPRASARKELSAKYPIAPDELVLSTVQYLRPIKRPRTLIEACGLLNERGVKFRLFVAGDGEMLEELQQLASSLGIADRVHWLGLVPDPTSLLQASDAFLLSTIGEAFGLVLAEAMACAVPVVGTRAGAMPEVVKDQETGILVGPDAESFADALERLSKNEAWRKKLSEQSVEWVRKTFPIQRAVSETLRIYDSV